MKDRALIGLLCQNLNPVPFYNHCKDMPVRIIKFKAGGIDWKKKRLNGIILENGEWTKAETPMPDAVYNRCYTDSAETAERLEGIIGRGKVFNGLTLFDKYTVFRILSNSKLEPFVIPTFKYSDEALIKLLYYQGAALIKPSKGSMGSRVYKISMENSIYKVYLHSLLSPKIFKQTEALLNFLTGMMKRRNFVIQPFINFMRHNGHIFDIRLLVQKNGRGTWDVTATASRVCYKSSFVSNLVYSLKSVEDVISGTKYEESLMPCLKKISIQTAVTLEKSLCNLGEISVDFGIDTEGRLWIIEVNGKPDKLMFQHLESGVFEKLFRQPNEYALYLARH